MKRPVLVVLWVCGLATVGYGQTKTPNETLQKVAFCRGVLMVVIEKKISFKNWDDECSTKEKVGDVAMKACIAERERQELEEYRDKEQRLVEFIRASIFSEPEGARQGVMRSIAMFQGTGRNTVERISGVTSKPGAAECYARCKNLDRCYIDCISERIPGEASVLRCVLLEDGLPY